MEFNKEQELEEALEQQIDIVLKLEEERLALSKQNTIQKEQIQELKEKMQTQTQNQKTFKDAASQTNNKKPTVLNQEIQTDSILQQKNSIKEEKKTSTKQVTKKLTKLQPSINDKENCRQQAGPDSEIIAEELKRLTKENRTMKVIQYKIKQFKLQIKLQERQSVEQKKKLEKENADLTTQIEIKNQSLSKLRNEISEISTLLNTDKCKTIKLIEQKLQKEQEQNKQFQKIILEKNEEQKHVNEELLQFKECLNKIQNDYEKLVNSKQQINKQDSEELKQLSKQNQEIQQNNSFVAQQLEVKAKMIEELSIQINKMNEEILNFIKEFYKSISLSSKSQAEKAQNNAEYYKLQYFNLRNSSSKV